MTYSFAPIFHFLQWLFAFSAVLTKGELSWLDDLLIIYLAMLFARVMFLIKGNSGFWALPALLLVALIYGTSQLPFTIYRDFWLSEPEEEQSSAADDYTAYRNMDAESLIYRQQELLTEKLAGLKPERHDEVELFFVGFAAYAHEDVFVKEVNFIRGLLDQRFDTAGHSLNLVNHLSRIDDTPLATATNLSLALKKIGKLMNPEEDVLMLYLTSHGSENSLAVSFWPMALNNVTPKNLKKMLDAAGIKWRIIVVSSCYSGGFVSELQNPYTLVATAAASDRKSFGCGTESEFTYFGEAVFKDQLQRPQPIVTAFKNAVTAIAKRESEEKLEPSKPQLVVGKDIENKLHQYETALSRQP